MILGERIKNARKKIHLTQAELAEKIGVHEVTVRTWENTDKCPNTKTMPKLAAALETSVAYILGETDDPSPPKNIQVWENVKTGELLADFPKDKRQLQQSDPRSEVFDELDADPRKFAAAALLAGMNDDQLRKAYDFLSDQKRLQELLKEKGA
jgi:transcriptional regulator with XRE-family HTH domain